MANKEIDHKAPHSDQTEEVDFTKNVRKLPPEIIEIHEAQDAVKDLLWWKQRLDATAIVAYIAFGVIWIIRDVSAPALIGMCFAGLLWIFSNTVLSNQVGKRRIRTWKLICAYNRKKAVPLYHDLLEKFADQPHLHIHLDDDGTIQITDRRDK
jgi:hypothetical protein